MIRFYSKAKSLLTVLLLILFCNSSYSQLIISQYYEGASYNKFIELTNVGNQEVDLSTYKLSCWYKSGAGSASIDFTATPTNYALSGNIASGETIVIRNNRKTETSVDFIFPKELKFDIKFNGNDGVALINSQGDLIDIGLNNVNGANKSFVRNFEVNTGNTTYDSSEWVKYTNSDVKAASIGDANRLGYHTFSSSDTKSSAKDIKSFVLDGKSAKINTTTKTVELSFYNTKDITALIPNITISGKASISPETGVVQNFSSPVVYTITAEDGSTNQYTVNVSLIEKSDDPLVINELDYNQVGTDTKEFVELYDGGKGNFSLSGYVLVMYNGKGNKSYLAYDLSEYSTNENGYFVLGSPLVSNVDFSPKGFNLQNGPDGVALYKANISEFPVNTLFTSDNLVDILVYGNGDAVEMSDLLIEGSFIDGSLNGDVEHHSIYRLEDGLGGALNTSKYTAGIPTPGLSNLAQSTFPSLTLSTSVSQASENDKTEIVVSISSSKAINKVQTVNVSLSGERVSGADFSVTTNTLSIPANASSASITYTVVDDSELEGPEVFNFKIGKALNSLVGDNLPVPVNVLDNDGCIRSSYGTPSNPTYTKVSGIYNADLYSSLNGKSENDLRLSIQSIIANENTKGQNYGDIWDMLKQADQNPENPFEVWLIYLEKGLQKTQQDGHATGEVWNREHVWCQSLGSYKNGTSSTADGIDVYFSTSVNDLKHGHADGHHLRAAQKNENSSRGNKSFDDIDGALTSNTEFYEPPTSAKGDIARSLMYMAVRYNGLTINEEAGVTGSKSIGKLSTLLKWHKEDPVDDFEKNRNNQIAQWQNNRNPFIDNPDLVDYVYGSSKTKVWNSTNTMSPIISINEADKINFVYDNKLVEGTKQYIITAYSLTEDLIITTEGKVDISLDGTSWSHEIVIKPVNYLNENIFVRVSTDRIPTSTPELGVIKHISGDLTENLNVVCGIKSNKANQEITFDALANKTYGDASFELLASTTSSLAVSYRIINGPASIENNIVSITGVGTVEIEASQVGNEEFLAASVVVQSFDVSKASQTITFEALSDKVYGDSSFGLSASTTSSLAVSYRILSGPASIDKNIISITGVGTVEIEASQIGTAEFLAASVVARSFDVSKASQTITFEALSNKTYGDSSFALSASTSSSLAVSYRILSGPASIDKNILSITGVGTVEIEASQVGNENFSAANVVVRNFDVSKASQTITFEALSDKVYGDSSFGLSASTSSSLAVSYNILSGPASIENNIVSITGVGTVEIEASQVGNENFSAANVVVRSFDVSKASQTITFEALSDKVYGDSSFGLSASTSSSLDVSYSIISGPASIENNILSITGVGTVEIEASQVGNENFSAANVVVRSFDVSKASQTITFEALSDKVYGDSSFGLSARTSSSLAVSYSIISGPASIENNILSITGVGTVEIEASQVGNENFSAANVVVRSFDVSKASQTITFEALSDKVYGDSSFGLSASTSSSLDVSYRIISGPVSISSNVLTITGAGVVKVEAYQAGDDNYSSAVSVVRSFDIAKANQEIIFDVLSNKTYGDPDFQLSAISSSLLKVSFRVLNGPVSLNNDVLTLDGVGIVEIEAYQIGDDNYLAASSVINKFIVSNEFVPTKSVQNISFDDISNKVYNDLPFVLTANSDSSLPVSFIVLSGPAIIVDDLLTITGVGNVEVEAYQFGNDVYNQAISVVRKFEVSKANQKITFGDLADKNIGDASFDLSASTTSSLAVSFKILSGPASISSNVLTITGAGVVEVEASQEGNNNYFEAVPIVRSFDVAKANQKITFAALSSKTYGDASFDLLASTTSSLAVSFKVLSGPASIS